MSKYLIKKMLVLGIIIVFIGAIFTPIISGNNFNINNIKSMKPKDIYDAIQNNEKKIHTTSTSDWWPIFRHDSANTGCTTSIAPNTNQLCWKQTISDEIYSATPMVHKDRLYISTSSYYYNMFKPLKKTDKSVFEAPDFSKILNEITTYKDEYNGAVYCLDADKGTKLWEYSLYAPNDPLIIGDKVYVTDLNVSTASSSLYCLNAETGDYIWDKSVGGVVSAPTFGVDGKIILGCMDYYGYTGSLKCFDLDGNSLWTYPLIPYELIGFAPAYYDGKVYFNTFSIYSYFQGRMYCVNAENGNDIWDIPIFSFGSPVCRGGKTFAVDFDFYTFIGKLMCFDSDTGALIWEYPLGLYTLSFGTPAVSEDSVYVVVFNLFSYSSLLYRFSVNGTMVWGAPLPSGVYAFSLMSPICSPNKIFICTPEYYGYSSTLYCMAITNGSMLWSYNLDYESIASPSIADERVYIADYTGNIYAFEDALKIDKISGGILCTKAVIKNKGSSDLTDVSWAIDVDGGMFNIINKHAEGNIPTLQANESKTVRAFPVFGLGKIEIEVSVSMSGIVPIKKNLNGLALGLIVIIIS
jgi:outer membrane protein assembly factor BamB